MISTTELLFRGMEGDAQKGGSDISAHMASLYALARNVTRGEVVELGVGGGWSSLALLLGAYERGKGLISYDFWAGCAPLAKANFEKVGLKKGDPRVSQWSLRIKTSLDAAKDIPDGSVGLLFIDTSHHYEATKNELAAWLPKMVAGGVICGHDYLLERYNEMTVFGVKPAVDEFVAAHADRFRFQLQPYSWGLFILWPREA